MRYVILLVCLVGWGCGPTCIKGHYETVHVPTRVVTTVIPAGKVMIPTTRVILAHDEQRWICDQYRVER